MPRIRIVEVSMFGAMVSRHPIVEIDRQRVIRDADGKEMLAVQPVLDSDGTPVPGEEDVLELVLVVNPKTKTMGFTPKLRGTGTVTDTPPPATGDGSGVVGVIHPPAGEDEVYDPFEDHDSRRESLADPEE